MAYTSTIQINGTAIPSLPGISACGFIQGIYSPLTPRGDDESAPGANGVIASELPIDKYLITANVTLAGATTAAMETSWASLVPAARGTTGLVTLTRVLTTGTTTAPGRYAAGLDMSLINWTTGTLNLQWYQLKGLWSNDGGTTWTVP